jgi:hypothetical protein
MVSSTREYRHPSVKLARTTQMSNTGTKRVIAADGCAVAAGDELRPAQTTMSPAVTMRTATA